MDREPIKCANPNCDIVFIPKAHNGKYHSPECRTWVMNQRVLERYHARKAQRSSNIKRVCSRKGCSNFLSRYNPSSICEACHTEALIRRLSRYGWDEEKLREEYKEY